MLPAVIGLASGTVLLLQRDDDAAAPIPERDLDLPFLGLTRKQWLSFLKVAICGKPFTVSPSFRLGTFGFSVRRLCDLGAMQNPRVIFFGDRQVFDAEWRDPKNLRDFQRRPMVQYELFVRSMKDYADSPQVRDNINRTIDGEQLTQSGLLMLAHRAGLSGLTSWLESSRDRERFADNTTAFVKRANRIF